MAKKARVYDGTAWQELASAQTDLTAYSTTAQMNAAPNRLLQNLNFTTGEVATGTTTIPFDNTIPQITEGTQFMTLEITPTSATSILEIEASVQGRYTTGAWIITALFRDAETNALAASYGDYAAGTAPAIATRLFCRTTSGTTSPITFSVRAGGNNAGTLTFNGSNGGRIFGGVMASFITIKEYQA